MTPTSSNRFVAQNEYIQKEYRKSAKPVLMVIDFVVNNLQSDMNTAQIMGPGGDWCWCKTWIFACPPMARAAHIYESVTLNDGNYYPNHGTFPSPAQDGISGFPMTSGLTVDPAKPLYSSAANDNPFQAARSYSYLAKARSVSWHRPLPQHGQQRQRGALVAGNGGDLWRTVPMMPPAGPRINGSGGVDVCRCGR
jgi:hypothetical protein